MGPAGMPAASVFLLVAALATVAGKPRAEFLVASGNTVRAVPGGDVAFAAEDGQTDLVSLAAGDTAAHVVFATVWNEDGTTDLVKIDVEAGTKVKVQLPTGSTIRDLAFDSDGKRLFLANSNSSAIETLDLAGDGVLKAVVKLDRDDRPEAVAFDPCSKTVYWLNANPARPTIEFAAADDGSNRGILVDTGLERPRGLAFDPGDSAVYWTDVRRANGRFRVERMRDRLRKVVCSGTGQSPFAVAVSEGSVAWTDGRNHAVWNRSKDDGVGCAMEAAAHTATRPMGLMSFEGTNSGCIEDQVKPKVTMKTDKIKAEEDNQGPSCRTLQCVRGTCHVTSMGNEVCRCERGFSGITCEVDLCVDFCLGDASACTINPISGYPECACQLGLYGDRCQFQLAGSSCEDLDGAAAIISVSAVVALLSMALAASLVAVAVLAVLLHRARRARPVVVRRRSPRSFSGSLSSSSKKAAATSAAGCDLATVLNGDGPIVDLEDCCRMTICDSPCVEATFRKATRCNNKATTSSANTSSPFRRAPAASSSADCQALLNNDLDL